MLKTKINFNHKIKLEEKNGNNYYVLNFIFSRFLIGILKLIFKKYSNFNTFITIISGILGALLGLLFFYIAPEIIPTDNVYHSIIEGLVIGLSSTGSIEMVTKIKDLIKLKKEKSNPLVNETQDSANNTKNET